jgi:hypothetical protein
MFERRKESAACANVPSADSGLSMEARSQQ